MFFIIIPTIERNLANLRKTGESGMWHSRVDEGARGVTVTFEYPVRVEETTLEINSDSIFKETF